MAAIDTLRGASAAPALPLRVKLFYALGQTAEYGYSATTGFVFFYYTAVLGMSGKSVGLALGLAMMLDAALDPLIGSATDSVRSRFGRRLPVMVIATPLLALSGVAMFAPPVGLTGLAIFLWLLLAKMAIRGFSSLYNLPYFALGAELTEGSSGERSSLVAYRTAFGIVVTLLVTVLAYSVFFAGPKGLQSREAYPALGWALGVIFLVFCWLSCAGVWRWAARLPQPMAPPAPTARNLASGMLEVASNRSFQVLFLSSLTIYVAVGINATLDTYAYVFAFKLTPAMIQSTTLAYLAGLTMGVPLAPLALRFVEKRTLVILGLIAILVAWTILPLLWVLGVFRPVGAEAMPLILLKAWVGGFGLAFPSIAHPAMLADAAEEHEVRHGVRREGLYFAGQTFANKAAIGLGGMLSGLIIDFIRFPKEAGRTVGVVVPGEVLSDLLLAWGPIPSVLGGVAVLLLLPYGITRVRHAEIAAQLREKRAIDRRDGRST